MTEPAATNGPGPVIHGPHRTNPGVFVIQLPNGELATGTQTDIATIPIAHQWFTGTKNGLIASWPTRAIAEDNARQKGVILGQIAPITTTELTRLIDAATGGGKELDELASAARAVADAYPEAARIREAIDAYDAVLSNTADTPDVKFVMLLNPNGQPLHGA